MSAPVSQMSAAVLPPATEQLALVSALGELPDDACTLRFRMLAELFEHEGQVLSDELRARDAALAGGMRQQAIVVRIERNRRGFFPGQCHGSNMTWQTAAVKTVGPSRRTVRCARAGKLSGTGVSASPTTPARAASRACRVVQPSRGRRQERHRRRCGGGR